MSEMQTVIRTGAEGGDWVLLGRRQANEEWEFRTRLVDQSYALLGESGEIRRDSEWLGDWRSAMLGYARYPWERLAPLEVHPDFRELVWDALVRRGELLKQMAGSSRMAKWTALCGKTPSSELELAAGPDAAGIPLRRRDGSSITLLDDWTRPKESYQWRDGRSAKELAKAWLTPSTGKCPLELRRLLDSSKQTQGIRLLEAWPEYVTALPERGEGRNHDLYVRGEQYGSPVTICVEAKADEPFGNATVGEYVRRVGLKVDSDGNPVPSGVPARVKALLHLLDNGADPMSEPFALWRYQLLTAVAGTALQAGQDGSPLAVLVIHELRSDELDKGKLEQNDAILRSMLESLDLSYFGPEHLVGPIKIRSSCSAPGRLVDLFIGKIVTDIAVSPSHR